MISQSLFAITITAETLPQAWQKNPDNISQHLDRLLLLGRGAHATMRVMLLELRPDLLVSSPLNEQFQYLAAMLLGRKNLSLSLDVSPDIDEPRLPPLVHEALYRISQEVLNNIIKHSIATEVDMRLTKEAGIVKLFIRDNGRGFERGEITPMLGMFTMRERAEEIGAQFELTSVPHQGTSVRVEWHPDN
jgi:signal transduction histidine kinase